MLFTRRDLSRFNGRDGMPAYVASEGKVYDVSGSILWHGGNHKMMHEAGKDLTRELDAAPHDMDMLKRFPVVGLLVDFEEIDHTADIGIRAYGKTTEELFETCAYGMYAVMLERYEPSREGERSFKLGSESMEGLLVRWLSELLFYFETESLIFSDLSVVVSGAKVEKKLSARASFCHYDEKKHGYAALIKAVTYHNLEIRREKGIYVVEVIFDV